MAKRFKKEYLEPQEEILDQEALETVEAEIEVKSLLEVKATIELTKTEKAIIEWHKKGQSVEWLAGAYMLPANQIKKILEKQ